MKLRIMFMGLCLSLGAAACAEPVNEKEAKIRQGLESSLPNVEIRSVTPTGAGGLYEVRTNYRETFYVTDDGKHFLVGDLYRVDPAGVKNLTEVTRNGERAELMASIPEAEMVVFKPRQTKASITVFTDVDCGYCRKLHQEVPQMNELGIQVNYVGYPRSGVGSSSHQKLVAVWCADDRQQAMTAAKRGEVVKSKNCTNPVASQYELGNALQISGTPAIILESGELIPGYVPAKALAEHLGLLN